MEKLNKLDLQILRVVSRDARITIKDMALECKASRAAVNHRLQRLINNGIIASPGYSVNPEALGYKTCTFVGIRLEKGSLYTEVAKHLSSIKEVVECHATTGRFTMIIKLYAADNQDLMRILNKTIQTIPGIIDTETLISLEKTFERTISVPNILGSETN